MKIKSVDIHRCDNPKCRSEFELTDSRASAVLSIESSKLWETTTQYRNINGATYCRPCTLKILNAMGR